MYILLRTYSNIISIIYTIKTSYTLLITILLNRLALCKKDIKSSESRKSHTHSTKLTTALTAHVYSKMDFCPLDEQRPRNGMSKRNTGQRNSHIFFFFVNRNKLSAELQRVSA